MFNIKLPQFSRPDHGRSGEGTGSMLPHLQRQAVRPAAAEFDVTAWADTCPGSFDQLWKGEGEHQHSRDRAFAPTMTMGLSEL